MARYGLGTRVRVGQRIAGIALAGALVAGGVATLTGAAAAVEQQAAAAISSIVAPLPSGDSGASEAMLTADTCPSSGVCVAIGGYYDSAGQAGLIEVRHSGSWTATKAPLPSDAASSTGIKLTAVSCVSTSSCVAVGNYLTASKGYYGLIETLAGGTWTASTAPLPSIDIPQNGPAVHLYDVSCSGGTCAAVGDNEYVSTMDGNTYQSALIETLSGGSWTAEEAPTGSGETQSLAGVSCPAAGDCEATGWGDLASPTTALIETLSAGTWQGQWAPLPANAANFGASFLQAISCISVGACVSSGYYTVSDSQEALIETLTGSTWQALQAPLPSSAGSNPLVLLPAISCASTTCAAAGTYTNRAGVPNVGFLETLASGTWSAIAAPRGAHNSTTISFYGGADVACTASGRCLAAGGGGHFPDGADGAIEKLTNGSWHALETPFPAGWSSPSLVRPLAAACPSTGSCVAVGWVGSTPQSEQGVIITTSA